MASSTHTSQQPDKRLNAYRPDLADQSLEGQVEANRFVAGTKAQVIAPVTSLHRHPDAKTGLDSEVLFGEHITIFDVSDGWAWVQLERDSYVGYVPHAALSTTPMTPTHRIAAIGSFVFSKPDIKSPPLMCLSMNALLSVSEPDGLFLELAPRDAGLRHDGVVVTDQTDDGGDVQGGYVIARHTAELTRPALDFVEIAERFIGTPYLWGGVTRLGLDCSGLVQTALRAAGETAPRDSDMQQSQLGVDVLVPADLDGLQRGDLVFWPGHVGIMTDGIFLLHANAYHMATAVEPLAETVLRIERTGASISAIKRLARYAG